MVNTANKEISKNTVDGNVILSVRSRFLAAFNAIDADAKMEKRSREAVFQAIFHALLIGLASESPELLARLRRDQLARAHLGRKSPAAPQREAMLAAVRVAIKGTSTKPTRGEAFARLIQPSVAMHLGRDEVSIWTVRAAIRVALKEMP